MPIYTKKGDAGQSSVLNQNQLPKNDPIFEAIGSLDELNAYLGIIVGCCSRENDDCKELLIRIQHYLFSIGSYLAGSKLPDLLNIINEFEQFIDLCESQLTKLTQFIIPGGCELASKTHLARTICRRCERNLVGLYQKHPQELNIIKFINRLSDLLFIMARLFNQRAKISDIFWDKLKSGLAAS